MPSLRRVSATLWEIPAVARPDMRVPVRVFADQGLLESLRGDGSLEQLQNVATLPGIVEAALAMPDVHQGYGFPVGGVAATALPSPILAIDARPGATSVTASAPTRGLPDSVW